VAAVAQGHADQGVVEDGLHLAQGLVQAGLARIPVFLLLADIRIARDRAVGQLCGIFLENVSRMGLPDHS
jgi:hypothetical protein